MTTPRFDDVMHAPNRLQICALLASVDSAEFATMRESLGVADSVLSKHLRVLIEAGYVRSDKLVGMGRAKTWAKLTKPGRAAFASHVAELQRLASMADLPD